MFEVLNILRYDMFIQCSQRFNSGITLSWTTGIVAVDLVVTLEFHPSRLQK